MGQKMSTSAAPIIAGSQNASGGTQSRAGVSVLRISPTTASQDDAIMITGVGFFPSQGIWVRYNEDTIDYSPNFINATCLRSVVPTLSKPGPVKIAVSFDGGKLWNNHKGFTYDKREIEPSVTVVTDTRSPSNSDSSLTLDLDSGTVIGEAALPNLPGLGDFVLPPTTSEDVLRVADKLRPLCGDAHDEDTLLEMAHMLSDKDQFHRHYFRRFSDIAGCATTYQEQLTEGDAFGEADKRHIEDLLRYECDLKNIDVRLYLTDVMFGTTAACSQSRLLIPYPIWLENLANNRDQGFVHFVIQVGPWMFEWQSCGVVLPLPAIYVESIGVDSDTELNIKLDLSTDDSVLKEISSLCVEWNTIDRDFGATHYQNSEAFIRRFLLLFKDFKIPSLGALDLFMTHLREMEEGPKQFYFIEPETKNKTEFLTHERLEEYCRNNKALLYNKDNYNLLQLIDRAYWRKWMFFGEDAYYPCIVHGCYFGSPEVIERDEKLGR